LNPSNKTASIENKKAIEAKKTLKQEKEKGKHIEIKNESEEKDN